MLYNNADPGATVGSRPEDTDTGEDLRTDRTLAATAASSTLPRATTGSSSRPRRRVRHGRSDTAVEIGPLGSQAGHGATVGVTITDPVVAGNGEHHEDGRRGQRRSRAPSSRSTSTTPRSAARATPNGHRSPRQDQCDDRPRRPARATSRTSLRARTGSSRPLRPTTTTRPPTRRSTVGLGSAAHAGDTVPVSFVDPAAPGRRARLPRGHGHAVLARRHGRRRHEAVAQRSRPR